MNIKFKDYRKIVVDKINNETNVFLEEVCGELESQTKRNTKVDTGKTKGSWQHKVDTQKHEGLVGSTYINALWEEFGTGIYALNGNGRKTPWVYKNLKTGKFYTTVGKKPRRALYNAYNSMKNDIIKEAQRRFKDL